MTHSGTHPPGFGTGVNAQEAVTIDPKGGGLRGEQTVTHSGNHPPGYGMGAKGALRKQLPQYPKEHSAEELVGILPQLTFTEGAQWRQ